MVTKMLLRRAAQYMRNDVIPPWRSLVAINAFALVIGSLGCGASPTAISNPTFADLLGTWRFTGGISVSLEDSTETYDGRDLPRCSDKNRDPNGPCRADNWFLRLQEEIPGTVFYTYFAEYQSPGVPRPVERATVTFDGTTLDFARCDVCLSAESFDVKVFPDQLILTGIREIGRRDADLQGFTIKPGRVSVVIELTQRWSRED